MRTGIAREITRSVFGIGYCSSTFVEIAKGAPVLGHDREASFTQSIERSASSTIFTPLAVVLGLLAAAVAPAVGAVAPPPLLDAGELVLHDAHELAIEQNPVLDPGFGIDGSPHWDVVGDAEVVDGKLLLAGGSAAQEFVGVGLTGQAGAGLYANVDAVSFRADGSGDVRLVMFDPEAGQTFVALDAPFDGTGGRVRIEVPSSDRVARSSPFIITFTGGPAAIDDAALEGVGLVAREANHAALAGTATREGLVNGGLEGPANDANGFRLALPGAALTSSARTGAQAANLAVAMATPRDWYALGQVAVLTGDGVALRDLDSFGFHYNVPAALTRGVGFQNYISLDVDGDGSRDECLVQSRSTPIARTSGWAFQSFDDATTYFSGGEDCPGGSVNNFPLSTYQANPLLGSARVMSVHLQTVPDTLAPWPAGQPIIVDDLALTLAEADADEDGVVNSFESDLSDGYSVSILPSGVVDGTPAQGIHIAPSRGTFTFDVEVFAYESSTEPGTKLALDPSRTAVFSLFDLEDLSRIAEGADFVNEPGETYWHSAEHPGSIVALDGDTLRVSVRVADVPAIVEALELGNVGAWAFYDVADGDTYAAPYGLAEPASDYFSLARNAVREHPIADALAMAGTPLVLTLPPTDFDDDGFTNDEEIGGALTLEQAIYGPFDPAMTPLDRDGDGFNNTEEDRNNNGLVEAQQGETDPDDATSFPVPAVTISYSPSAPREGEIVTLTANIDYAPPVAPPGAYIVDIAWQLGDGTNATGASVTHAYSQSGVYTARVTVTENHGASNSTTAAITVVNIPPVASFTQTPSSGVTQLTPVNYTSTSTDVDGTVVGHEWRIDGTLVGTASSIVRSYTSDGVHNVCLRVVDDTGANHTRCEQTSVLNIAPSASFVYSSTVAPTDRVVATRAAQFDSTSVDTPGDIVGYEWRIDGVLRGTSSALTYTFATAGTYSVALLVRDDDGATSTSTRSVAVGALPAAAFTWTPTQPDDRTSVQFTDTSTHPDGHSIVNWSWSFGDGTGKVYTKDPLHQFADDGAYVVTHTVRDAYGVTSVAVEQTITILNIAPTASFTVAAGELLTSAPVQFNDTSTDPDGSVAAWEWSFGDNATSAARNASHTYSSTPGTFQRDYTVTLRVKDDDGAWSAMATRTITVLQDTDEDATPDVRDTDDDNDGYSDALETAHGTSTTSASSTPLDTDRDGTPDEDVPGFPGDTDDDNDSYSDSSELSAGSDPKDPMSTPDDFDGDEVPNLVDSTLGRQLRNPAGHRDPCFPFEFSAACVAHGGSPDTDGDGWTNVQERILQPAGFQENNAASPPVAHPGRDTDGDGIPDAVENVRPPDGDADGVPDQVEVALCERAIVRDTLATIGAAGRCVSPTDFRPGSIPGIDPI